MYSRQSLPSRLTPNGIKRLIEGETSAHTPTSVQVLAVCGPEQTKPWCLISDGHYKVKAILPYPSPLLRDKHENSIINISKNVCSKKKSIGLVQFDVAGIIPAQLGNPIDVASLDGVENIQHFDQGFPIQKQVSAESKQQFSQAKAKTQPVNFTSLSPGKPLQQAAYEYDSVSDLFIDKRRWTLLARLVSKNQSQFTSKKTQQPSKLISLQLMDRNNKKINAVGFGDVAITFSSLLSVNTVYLISDCSIIAESYQNSRSGAHAPIKLMLTPKSVFDPVCDVGVIGNNQDAARTLGQIVDRGVVGQEYDIVGVLLSIGEQGDVEIKGEKVPRRELIIGDPLRRLTITCSLWREQAPPNIALIGRTVVLYRFRLKEYNKGQSLSSIVRSQIQLMSKSHEFMKFQFNALEEFQSYENLSELSVNPRSQSEQSLANSISQVLSKSQQLPPFTPGPTATQPSVKSELSVYVSRFHLKKWFYDGCPHCKHAMDRMSVCQSCQKYSDQPVSHYIMGIELCDWTGSLWSTAYDQFGERLFGKSFLNTNKSVQSDQLRDITQGYMYRQFRIRMYSRRNQMGLVKHQIGRIYQDRKACQITQTKNIQSIKTLTHTKMELQ